MNAKALQDHHLADFVARGTGRQSVIVEARRDAVVPSQATSVRRVTTDPRGQLPPKLPSKAKIQATPARVAPVAQMHALEAELQELGLVDRARPNALAGSFVVEVTPEELSRLSELPSVQAIRLNRFHRRAAA